MKSVIVNMPANTDHLSVLQDKEANLEESNRRQALFPAVITSGRATGNVFVSTGIRNARKKCTTLSRTNAPKPNRSN